jgi:hypothetical protein
LVLLGAIATGFACLALWRVIQAFVDPGGYGRDWRGIAIRAALGASALVYVGIGVFAVRLMLGWAAGGPSESGSAVIGYLSKLLSAPLGPWFTGALGLAVIALGVTKGFKAWRADLGEHLACNRRLRIWAIPLSRFGLTARGVVFVLIGASVFVAAIQAQAESAAGLAGVLAALESTPYGWMLLVVVALGLTSFGIFGLIEAMYRRIDAKDID